MSDERNRLRKTIEAYGDAIGHSLRGTERSREEARCAASDMMDQALAMFDALRERAEKAERFGRCSLHGHAHAQCNGSGCGCICTDLARLARYEATGPVLLTAEHDAKCLRSLCSWGCSDPNCAKAIRDAAYREQHARCVAAVERVAADLCVTNRDAAVGAKRALAALTGEAEKCS